MTKSKLFSVFPSLLALALVALVSAGCTCDPCYQTPTNIELQTSAFAPPPPLYEAVPERASPQTMIWKPGYWQYGMGGFYWVNGEMVDRPSPTAVWSPDHWIKHTYGWVFVPGYWH